MIKLFGFGFEDISKTTNNIDSLIKKYKDLSIAQSAVAMANDGVAEAEARAMLAKQGYDQANINSAITEAYNRQETERNTQAKLEQVAAESKDASTTKINTDATNAQTTAIKAETQALNENSVAKSKNAIADVSENISDTNNINLADKSIISNKNNNANKTFKNDIDAIGESVKSTTVGLNGFVNSIKQTTVAQKAATLSTKVLSGALTLLKGTLFTIGISVVVNGIMNLVTKQKELAEATKSSAEELANEKEQINDYVNRYNQLHDALLQAKGNEEETYEVKKNLLALQTELNEKYGDEYGKLNLVADAYKNVSDSIENISKQKAEQWLNKNQKGYEQAVDALNKVKTTYLTGELNIASITPELDALSKEFEDRGIIFDKNEASGTFRIKLTANAEDAVDVLNDFMTKLRDIYEMYPEDSIMSNYFNQILENSSRFLKENQDTVEQYEQIRKQGLLSELATDENYTSTYDDLIEKQQALQEAILNNGEENPFDDESFKKAYEEYKTFEENLLNDSTWEKFRPIIEELGRELGLEIYDFQNKLLNTTDQGITNALSDMKGMTDIELESLFNSIDEESATTDFEKNLLKIKDNAEECGIEISSLISILENLGYVTDSTSNEVVDMNNKISYSYGEVLSKLSEYSPSLDKLNEVYAKFADNDIDTNINTDDLASLKEEFSDIDGIDNYIEAIQEAKGSAVETQEAFNDLATVYIDQNDVLDLVNENTAELIETWLEEKGIVNSNEIVQRGLARRKAETALASKDVANMTIEEINALSDEIGVVGEGKRAFELYVVEKMIAEQAINPNGDITALSNIINTLGIATDSWKTYFAAKNNIDTIQSGTYKTVNGVGYYEVEKNGETYLYGENYVNSIIETANKALTQYGEEVAQMSSEAIVSGGSALSSGGGSGGSGGSDKDPTEFDWIERKLEVINEKIEKTKTNIENLVGYKSKNAETNTALDLMTDKLSTLQKMYDYYMNQANNIGLSQDYINKIQNGEISIETIGDEDLANLINQYQDLYDKAQNVSTEIDNTKVEIKELNLSKLDNIVDQYEQILDIRNQMLDTEEQLIDLRERSGETIVPDDYISLAQKQFQIVQENKEAFDLLSQEMNSLNLAKGSEEWKEYNDQLETYKNNIISATQAIEDYKDTITDLIYSELNDYISAMDSINESISTMTNLIGDSKLIDDAGKLTERGLAQVALYGQQMAIAKQQAEEYDNAINSLNEALSTGLITQDEYNERLYEYISAQNNAVESVKAAKDAILNLVKEGIQAEIDAKKKLIDTIKEELDAEKDLHDYQNSISEKQDNISKLERQIAALSNSTSREDLAQRLQLQQELAEAREDLYETQYDHEIEQRKEALDKEYEEYEENKQNEMDELDSNLDKQNEAIENYLDKVKNNYSTIYSILNQYGEEYNLSAIEDLTSPWESGSEAANMCASAIGEAIANINYEISNINLSPLYELIEALHSLGYGENNTNSYYDNITSKGSWQQGQGGKWWFGEEYNPNGDYYYASGGIYTITDKDGNDKQYAFDDDGYMITGWYNDNDNWRYFETDNNGGEMVKSSWRQGTDGNWYYLTKDGTMAENMAIKQQGGDHYYYVDENGVWDGKELTEEDVDRLKLKKGYKVGTKNAQRGIHLVDEEGLGSEVIVTKHGVLEQFKGGETVFNSDMVQKLWDFAKDPNNFIDKITKSVKTGMNIENIKPVQSQVIFDAPLFSITGGLSNDMVSYIDEKCNWLQENIGNIAYKDLKKTLLGK